MSHESHEKAMRVHNILVVDDNSHNRLVAEGHLVAAGYAVTLAESGEDAIRAFEARRPDLVLLDILMPGLDGFETCKRLKALRGGTDVPIVFLTALSDLGSHQKALESGADDFLTKPINRTELLIRVRSLLWMKRLKDELSDGYELIRSQRDALVRAQRQKEELSALVVHDLKGPLTAIYATVLFIAQDPETPESIREFLRDAATAAQTMHRMIMNLLDISRSEDGQLAPSFVDVDVPSLLAEVCDVLDGAAHAKGQHLETRFGSALMTVKADRDLLLRLIENLLENSIKYAPSASTIRIDGHQLPDGPIELRIRDEGPGIPVEFRDRIFDKYFQLKTSDDVNTRSSRGLGLAFCRLAVEAHGGRIWVEDNRPRGSVFCVSLPSSQTYVRSTETEPIP